MIKTGIYKIIHTYGNLNKLNAILSIRQLHSIGAEEWLSGITSRSAKFLTHSDMRANMKGPTNVIVLVVIYEVLNAFVVGDSK